MALFKAGGSLLQGAKQVKKSNRKEKLCLWVLPRRVLPLQWPANSSTPHMCFLLPLWCSWASARLSLQPPCVLKKCTSSPIFEKRKMQSSSFFLCRGGGEVRILWMLPCQWLQLLEPFTWHRDFLSPHIWMHLLCQDNWYCIVQNAFPKDQHVKDRIYIKGIKDRNRCYWINGRY